MTDSEKLKKAQLMIAREIKRVCEKNNINYFLDSGSLLGSIRHKGFIPWDDDIDIGMLQDDYKKFLEIAPKELRNGFFVDNYEVNDEYGLMFSKVRLAGTTYVEEKGNENAKHNEIFVDIFPYYYISDNLLQRKIEGNIMRILAHVFLIKSENKPWKGEKCSKYFKFIPIRLLALLASKKRIYAWADYLTSKHRDTECVCIKSTNVYGYWFFSKDILQDFIDGEFEGEYFKIPQRYDEYLKSTYGNYMQLPPEEDRKTHLIKRLDFGDINIEEDCGDEEL